MMKLKCRKGMSLVEVLIAFVLLGFIVLMVGGAVTSVYKTSVAMQKIPGLYYEGQSEIEYELNSLEEQISQKYLYEKELASASAAEKPGIKAKIDEVTEELYGSHEIVSVRLFGKDVTVYQFKKDCEREDVGTVTLVAGTAGGVRFERPVPVISSNTISAVGQSVKTDIFNADGLVLSTDITYSDVNSDYKYLELYQWYISTGDTHSVYYEGGEPGPNETLHSTVMPVYPSDFTLIASERTATMTVTSEYRGKFVFCLATPLSINGKMGEPVMSNIIYISDLPAGYDYKTVLDPSLTVMPYKADGKYNFTSLNSTDAAGGTFSRENGSPYIDQYGEFLSENAGSSSRFIHFGLADSAKSSGTSAAPADGDVVICVARSLEGGESDFITAGTKKYGFTTHDYISDINESGWAIIACEVSKGDKYSIGKGVDIAELIIIRNPGPKGYNEIIDYLNNKYKLS